MRYLFCHAVPLITVGCLARQYVEYIRLAVQKEIIARQLKIADMRNIPAARIKPGTKAFVFVSMQLACKKIFYHCTTRFLFPVLSIAIIMPVFGSYIFELNQCLKKKP